MKTEPIPQTDVLEWLKTNHPHLHTSAELERAWVWLVCDLRGEEHKATRESLKQYGFRFKAGGHTLPSGHSGSWAHACEKPIAFRRKGKSKTTTTNTNPNQGDRVDALAGNNDNDGALNEAAAFFNS